LNERASPVPISLQLIEDSNLWPLISQYVHYINRQKS
jgi:hypothetical protein